MKFLDYAKATRAAGLSEITQSNYKSRLIQLHNRLAMRFTDSPTGTAPDIPLLLRHIRSTMQVINTEFREG
jgi:hypothetical protein